MTKNLLCWGPETRAEELERLRYNRDEWLAWIGWPNPPGERQPKGGLPGDGPRYIKARESCGQCERCLRRRSAASA